MSFGDLFIKAKAMLGVGAPEWNPASNPQPPQFDDAVAVAAAVRARRDSDAQGKLKGAFETTAEYAKRMTAMRAASERGSHDLLCTFLIQPSRYGHASYDADSRRAKLPVDYLHSGSDWCNLVIHREEFVGGRYTLTNIFGAECTGARYETVTYNLHFSPCRTLLSVLRIVHPTGVGLQLDREYARSELPYLRLSTRVRVDAVSDDAEFWSGGDWDVPDSRREATVLLHGRMLTLDVINIRKQELLGGWRVKDAF